MSSEETYKKWEGIGFLAELSMIDKIEFSVELEKMSKFFSTVENNDYENFICYSSICVMRRIKDKKLRLSATDVYMKYTTFIDELDLDFDNIELYEESLIIDKFLEIHYK